MSFKQLRLAALAVLMVVCVLFAGCSTPAVALTVGGTEYTTGDYFAYVYNTLSGDSTAYFYLYYYGAEALSQTVSYGEGDDAEDIRLDEYIRRVSVDAMIRQVALEELLAEHGVALDADLQKEAEDALKKVNEGDFLSFGFTTDRYKKMYRALSLNEASLFTGLYGKGGKREVPEADIRQYFDDNYRSFYALDVSLVGSDGKTEKSEAEVKKIEEQLNKALEEFNKTKKTVEDFQTIYRKYKSVTQSASTSTTGTASGSTTAATTTTTTTATTTTTTKVTTAATGTGTTTAGTTASDTDTEKKDELSRQDVAKTSETADEDLMKAVEKIAEGEAGVQTYQKNGTTKTMSLIFRIDPESNREKDENYYEDNREQTLQLMKYEEFDKEVSERADKLAATAVKNNRAIKAVDIAEMLGA